MRHVFCTGIKLVPAFPRQSRYYGYYKALSQGLEKFDSGRQMPRFIIIIIVIIIIIIINCNWVVIRWQWLFYMYVCQSHKYTTFLTMHMDILTTPQRERTSIEVEQLSTEH